MTTPAPAPVPRLPIPNGVQMILNMDQGGQPAVVVFGLVAPTGLGTQAQSLAQVQRAWGMIQNATVTTTVCTGAIFRTVDGGDSEVQEVGPPSGPAGSQALPVASAAACALFKWSTPNGSRSGKGRTFVPGLPQTFLQPNGRNLTSAAVSALTGGAQTYITSSNTAGIYIPAVLSFKRGVAYPITTGAVSGTAGIQRRRMR